MTKTGARARPRSRPRPPRRPHHEPRGNLASPALAVGSGLVFLALNVTAFLVYHVVIAGQLGGLDQRLESRELNLATLVERREQVDGLLATAELNRDRIDQLYDETFATRRARLTRAIEEVKDLARRSGLDPQTISYPRPTSRTSPSSSAPSCSTCAAPIRSFGRS